jgi:hypothetical protein
MRVRTKSLDHLSTAPRFRSPNLQITVSWFAETFCYTRRVLLREVCWLGPACGPRSVLSGMSQPSSRRRAPHALVPATVVERIDELVENWLGLPLGANKAFHADVWKSGSQPRFAVGTFCRVRLRSGVLRDNGKSP